MIPIFNKIKCVNIYRIAVYKILWFYEFYEICLKYKACDIDMNLK